MSRRQLTCDPQRIDGFLSDQLSEAEQAEFENHLDACPACRTELEQRAAEPALWRDAREFLSSIEVEGHDATALEDAARSDRLRDGSGVSAGVDAVLGALAPTDDPQMLGRLGGYEITGVIGFGGMGVVLKGLDAALNRYVAIKVLAPHLAVSGAARRRFAREAQAAAAVVHENVVAIHCVADADDVPYFVMPYIRGPSLQKRLDEKGPLAVTEVLRVAIQTAAGLAAAHAQGLVHRDIKPANILLSDGVERVKITDFGLARAVDDASLTRTGVIAGTPQFMSPEQTSGEAVDARSDLFSLGSVMYIMCTGRPPFRAETSYGMLRRITDTEPRPIREINPDVPVWLAGIVGRLHSKAAGERFQSADELADLLERCLAHVQQPTTEPLPTECDFSETRGRWTTRFGHGRINRRTLAGILGAVALAAVVGVVAMQGPDERREEPANPSPISAEGSRDDEHEPITDAWEDGAVEKITGLADDVESLEQRAGRLWEVEDQPAADQTDPHIHQP